MEPGHAAGLQARDTAPDKGVKKSDAEAELEGSKQELDEAQQMLYASDTWSLLLIFQALDAAGKDGTIKHVMSGVNPQGCQVSSFKQPSTEELDHDFLWRCSKALPDRGRIGIFNRSYYEEVLVTRVHPELLEAQRLPGKPKPTKKFWRERCEDINGFERHLNRCGTKIVKFYLHVSADEQRRRFLDRIDNPAKHWKFSSSDIAERQHFDQYLQAYEDALTATSKPWAPWYVIPADDKPTMRMLVAGVVVDAIKSMDLEYPEPDEDREAAMQKAKEALLGELGHND